MNEENETQPVPTESASPEQRHHRPRRRFPRKRYRGRDDRFGRDNSAESPNSSSVNANPGSAVTDVETLDRPAAGAREEESLLSKVANKFRPNRNSAKVSLKSRARDSHFCATRSATTYKRRRIF